MNQSTHEIRHMNWMNIITQCKNRPENMTAKQWLAGNGISDKSYYYWLLKICLEVYEQLNVLSVTQSTEVSFADDISEELLHRLLKEASHAGRCC